MLAHCVGQAETTSPATGTGVWPALGRTGTLVRSIVVNAGGQEKASKGTLIKVGLQNFNFD
jgi:hypothetical protein